MTHQWEKHKAQQLPGDVARGFYCPRCGAVPNDLCEDEGIPRRAVHQERIRHARRILKRGRRA